MIYKCIIAEHKAKAKKTAKFIEEKATSMSEKGYELVTITMVGSKMILVFKVSIDCLDAEFDEINEGKELG